MIGRAVLPGKEPKAVATASPSSTSTASSPARTSASANAPAPTAACRWLYTLTRHGLEVAQQRKPPAIHPQREWRALEQRRAGTLPHNLHALVLGDRAAPRSSARLATDYWRTPRYATGRYPVPQIGNGHKRHPITMRELDVPDGHAVLDLPAVSRDQARRLTRAADPRAQAHLRPARRTRPHRPPLLQPARSSSPTTPSSPAGRSPTRATGRSAPARSSCSSAPTRAPRSPTPSRPTASMTGRIGAMGSAAAQWYYAGRDHVFFAAEPDIHHDSLAALASPRSPGAARAADRQRPTRTRAPTWSLASAVTTMASHNVIGKPDPHPGCPAQRTRAPCKPSSRRAPTACRFRGTSPRYDWADWQGVRLAESRPARVSRAEFGTRFGTRSRDP